MNIPLEGVYFKDELPKKLKTNRTYIINLQDSETDDGTPNDGTHWILLQVQETPKGQINPFYFDPYGVEPPEVVKERIKTNYNKFLPFNNKDIQSLMNNACGFYCLALAHYINASKYRTNNIYEDVEQFLSWFDDLNHSIDFKKNEYILKHFFLAEDENKRIDLNQSGLLDTIVEQDEKGGIDLMKLPVGIKIMDKK
jgi:hypothetical protein